LEQVAIRAWGNSQAIRIPKSIMDQMNISVSDVMDIDVEDDAIVIRKSFQHKSFKERLAAYDGKISICTFDWGEPAGKELL